MYQYTEYTGTNASTSSEGLERTLSSEPVQGKNFTYIFY